MLGFDVGLKGYEPTSVTFKISFENPLSVSQGGDPDIVRVFFPDPDMYVSASSG